MSNARITWAMQKARDGGQLSTVESTALANEVDRLVERLSACVQEVDRRDEASQTQRIEDRDRAERLRAAEEENERLLESLAHARRKRTTEVGARDERIKTLENLLRDVHYGLVEQPELTRGEIASVITSEVKPHSK